MSLILDPPLIAQTMVNVGEAKSNLSVYKMIILGMLAGYFLGWSNLFMQFILQTGETDPAKYTDSTSGPHRFCAAIGFCAGLVLIATVGAELFTGNCLMFMSCLAGRITFLAMLFEWTVVMFSNWAGAILAALIMWGAGVNGADDFSNLVMKYNASDPASSARMHIGHAGRTVCIAAVKKATLSNRDAFFRGICANTIVCLAILASTASKTVIGKIAAIVMVLPIFLVSNFEHSVANMWFFAMGEMLQCPGLSGADWIPNLILAILGNILGGALLSVAYWAVYLPHDTETFDVVPQAEQGHAAIQEAVKASATNATAASVSNTGSDAAAPDIAAPDVPAVAGPGSDAKKMDAN